MLDILVGRRIYQFSEHQDSRSCNLCLYIHHEDDGCNLIDSEFNSDRSKHFVVNQRMVTCILSLKIINKSYIPKADVQETDLFEKLLVCYTCSLNKFEN